MPAYPPRLGQLAQGWQVLEPRRGGLPPRVILVDHVVAPFVPTGGAVPSLVELQKKKKKKNRASSPTNSTSQCAGQLATAEVQNDDALALLQYTSGSTADPKGVMVSHRNMMHNQGEVILTALEHYRHIGMGVNWLPPVPRSWVDRRDHSNRVPRATLVLMSPIVVPAKPAELACRQSAATGPTRAAGRTWPTTCAFIGVRPKNARPST